MLCKYRAMKLFKPLKISQTLQQGAADFFFFFLGLEDLEQARVAAQPSHPAEAADIPQNGK